MTARKKGILHNIVKTYDRTVFRSVGARGRHLHYNYSFNFSKYALHTTSLSASSTSIEFCNYVRTLRMEQFWTRPTQTVPSTNCDSLFPEWILTSSRKQHNKSTKMGGIPWCFDLQETLLLSLLSGVRVLIWILFQNYYVWRVESLPLSFAKINKYEKLLKYFYIPIL